MNLTRTDDIFSRITVVLFLCRNKSSPNATKLFDGFFGTKEALEASWEDQKVKKVSTRHLGAPRSPGVPRWVMPTSVTSRTASLLYKYPNIPETLGQSAKNNSSRRKFQKP